MDKELTLICQAKSGDMLAFEALVKAHSSKLYGLALRALGNKELAEECVQEVFIKVYNKLESFNEQSKFSTWLHSITVNTAIDIQRRNAKHGKNDTETFDEFHSDSSSSPEKSAWIDDIGEKTQSALMQLGEEVRVAFILRHHQGHSIDEISLMLNLNPNTVKGRIFRAVARLREILQAEVGNYEAME